MPKCKICGVWRIGFFLPNGTCGRCLAGGIGADPEVPLDAESGRRAQLDSYWRNADILAGVQWSATMALTTPRTSLARHGEIFRGDPREAPEYGTPAEGFWVGIVDWAGLGVSDPEPGTMASLIGQMPIDGGTLLPFLLGFREIVEGKGSVESKITRIRDLCRASPEFSEIAERIRGSGWCRRASDGSLSFPESFFALDLQRIPGVGPAMAARLFQAGFRSTEELSRASDEALRAVDGVGPKFLAKIRGFID